MKTLLPALADKFKLTQINGHDAWKAVFVASDQGILDNYDASWNTGLFFWSRGIVRQESSIAGLLKEVLTVSAVILINAAAKGNQKKILTDDNYGMGALSQALWDGIRTDKGVGGACEGVNLPYTTTDFEIPASGPKGLQATSMGRRHLFSFYRETETWGDAVCPETI